MRSGVVDISSYMDKKAWVNVADQQGCESADAV